MLHERRPTPADAAIVGLIDDDVAIEASIAERAIARKTRDFRRADAIRAELLNQGIMLEDGPEGTTWRRVR